MAKQTLNNGDSGFNFRKKINENTTELYDTTVKNTGDQTIQDTITFEKAPVLPDGAILGRNLEPDYKDLLVVKYVKQSETVTKHYDRVDQSPISYPNSQGYAWALAFIPDTNITINGAYLKPTHTLASVSMCLLSISAENVIAELQSVDITRKWNENIGQVSEYYFDNAELSAGLTYAIGQKSNDLLTHIGFYPSPLVAGVSRIRPRITGTSWVFAVESATVMFAIPALFDTLKIKTAKNEPKSIEARELAYDVIEEIHIKDAAVSESKLQNNSVSANKVKPLSISEDKTTFLVPSKNLFNKDAEDVTLDKYVSYASGLLSSNTSYNTTGYIHIQSGQTYTRSYQHQTAFYDSNKVYVSGINAGSSPTFVAPANAYFVRCTVAKTAWETFQLEEGSESTGYVPYRYYLPEKYLPSVTPVKTFANDIVTPKKQYLLSNYENSIYLKALVRRWRPDYEFVRIEGGEWSNMKTLARITNPTVETATVNARIYDLDFEQVASDIFAVQIGNIATDNGAVKGIYIGDSLTYNGGYILKVNALLPNISWDGMRKSYSGEIYGEGRGGWALSTYFANIHSSATDSFTPFMHPIDPYKYYGGTAFWAAVVNSGSEYGNSGFMEKATEIGFDAITGLLTTPALNDCMWNDANGRYERWDGSAWVEITGATLNFSFNFAKYRSTWLIDQPDVVTVMLGTNDFRSQASESAIDGFWNEWKTRMDTLCASVIADSPSAKIAILLPPTDCGSLDNNGNNFTVKQTAMMWYGRKKIITDFDDREAEGIYLVDVGRSVDPDYGFSEIYQTPFSDYNGTEKRYVQGNTPHPGTDGYEQLGIPLAGWIQKIR